jgi:hypothetical protein
MNDAIFYANLLAILEGIQIPAKDAELCIATGQVTLEARSRLKAVQEAEAPKGDGES